MLGLILNMSRQPQMVELDLRGFIASNAVARERLPQARFTECAIDELSLAAGEHTIWIVVGDGTHTAFKTPVRDKVVVTVT